MTFLWVSRGVSRITGPLYWELMPSLLGREAESPQRWAAILFDSGDRRVAASVSYRVLLHVSRENSPSRSLLAELNPALGCLPRGRICDIRDREGFLCICY